MLRCIRLIEQFFLRRLYTLPEYNLKRMSAVFHEINLRPQINISHLSETACLSSKQFGRIFTDYVGTTPKEFIRIIRMQRALFMLQQDAIVPFVQVAYECGFSDQSHMINISSPPILPHNPLLPTASLKISATLQRTSSPNICPYVSLIFFKSVT